MQIRDPGWKKFGSGIRDKHPGSTTLIVGISFTTACLVYFLAALHFSRIGNCTFFSELRQVFLKYYI
jgi:hypothetical protein